MADEAKSPAQLADDVAKADTIKLNFGGEVYKLTKAETDWIVLALRGINPRGYR